MKCVACGNTALVEGTLIDNSSSGTSIFAPKELSIWKSMFGVGTREVRAYGCIHCQHLQLAISFSEEDLQRYQQFEGEQPGLLERINSEPREVEKLKTGVMPPRRLTANSAAFIRKAGPYRRWMRGG